ncbi:hypothetical protein SAY87_019379 [Trapa incisa]|uniref:Uncharacterized protein n=1 Tax=Trapa incisa TaxID=236973 RepID=A0AAN7K5N0_9MYRT|nr:hypothetical protein SAY87_019379 [Trapa incisa]
MDPFLRVKTACGTLLNELQIIWNEVGETDGDRDKILLEIEEECLEVYRRKLDQANRSRAQLRQTIADSEAELAAICSAMGERPLHLNQPDQNPKSLKELLKNILPQLEEMHKRKRDRRNLFSEVIEQIKEIANEISVDTDKMCSKLIFDETDLSLRKLEELHRKLHALQKEKGARLQQIQEHLKVLNSLCLVLGLDFLHTVAEVHASLVDSERPKDISTITIERLVAAIARLRELKLQRMQRLQDLATTMLELWNLMDTPVEEQEMFQRVTCNIAASEHEITMPNTLSVESINYVEAEVARLEELKLSKLKDLVLKKRIELEDICCKTHLIPGPDTAIEVAMVADPACVLEQIELEIGKVKEEAFSRKELLEKVEKWLAACEEESWLEDYNRDENRYNAGRGAHLMLKRAEKARVLVNKLPAMVESLTSKTLAWEKERGIGFTYDGIHLLTMLEEYTELRKGKEEERLRLRDQKKLHGQLITEQEALYGSKPNPSKTQLVKKALMMSTGGTTLITPKPNPVHSTKGTPNSRIAEKKDGSHKNNQLNNHDNNFAGLSAGKRGQEVTGLRTEPESRMIRKPFSPITTAIPTKVNMMNILDESTNSKGNELPLKTLPISPFSTPLKTFTTPSLADEQNRTPITMPTSIPSTPYTITVPMQTALTPAPSNATPHQEIEYSFEELRAGFVECSCLTMLQ